MNLKPYCYLMRFHKPIGIYLLLWPTLWGLWFAAQGIPSIKNLFIFVTGVIIMRAAGCVINDFADRHIDKYVTRTKERPLTTGQITPRNALILFSLLCVIAFILVLFTNKLTILLACFALFFAVLYPFTKRATHLPQLFLGIAFSFSIPMAYAAETNATPALAWVLMLANLLWTIAYDTEYALVDLKDDLKIGVKSTAILFGQYNAWIIGLLQTTMIMILMGIGLWQKVNWPYYCGLLLATGLIYYQQCLLKNKNALKAFNAFKNNHWLGFVIFAGIFINFLVP